MLNESVNSEKSDPHYCTVYGGVRAESNLREMSMFHYNFNQIYNGCIMYNGVFR